MLTCREVTELVTDYLEGRQSLWQRVRFELHLGMCRNCRAYLQQMRRTIRAARELGQGPGPTAVPEELLRRFRSWNG